MVMGINDATVMYPAVQKSQQLFQHQSQTPLQQTPIPGVAQVDWDSKRDDVDVARALEKAVRAVEDRLEGQSAFGATEKTDSQKVRRPRGKSKRQRSIGQRSTARQAVLATDTAPYIPYEGEPRPRVWDDLTNVKISKILASFIETDRLTGEKRHSYLVKFHGLSYKHARRVSESTVVLLSGQGGSSTLARFVSRFPVPIEFDEDAYPAFNPNFLIAERVLAGRPAIDGTDRMEYLVKWRDLPYVESTWEFQDDVGDQDLIDAFIMRHTIPDLSSAELSRMRPSPDAWIPITADKVYKNGNMLRPWQVEGVNWLLFNWHNRRGSLLGDEMGLGKTVQIVATLLEVANSYRRCPFLIVAPLSTLGHWQREFEQWSDFNVVVLHGLRPDRDLIRQYEWYRWDEDGREITSSTKFEVLICTYESAISDADVLRKVNWRFVVVDEGHRLKNSSCRLNRVLSSLPSEHRVLMTGTPVQNSVEELFALLEFLSPSTFSSRLAFMEQYSSMATSQQVSSLQEVLAPFLLRRMKEDVAKQLPPKEETIVEVELTSIQKQYYRAVFEKNREFLCRGANAPQLINVMMQLRKVCNHPFLVAGAEDRIAGSTTDESIRLKYLVESSGKLVLIDKLLPKLLGDGHKVLLFSQMKRVLDLLGEYLRLRKYDYERIDGDVRGDLRQHAIDRFNRDDSKASVFLLCTRAGGIGINLATADTVIIFDSDWNPQGDIQAQARAHRVGQRRKVQVYRLITSRSYEKEMFTRSSLKLGLDQAILLNMRASTKAAKAAEGEEAISEGGGIIANRSSYAPSRMERKEIDNLLRRGAYDLDSKEAEEATRQFCEADIDKILEQRSVVWRQSALGDSSSFSKASFASSSSDPNIDVNDEAFWEKMLPDLYSPSKLLEQLIEANDSFEGDAAKHEFLQRVQAAVNETIKHLQTGVTSKHFIPLLNVLGRLRTCSSLTSDEQFAASEWQHDLENPRKRRRKSMLSAKDAIGASLESRKDFESDVVARDEEDEPAVDGAYGQSRWERERPRNVFGSPTIGPPEARLLRETLLALASSGRRENVWEDLRDRRGDIGHPRSLEELAAYCTAYLTMCVNACRSDEDAELFSQCRERMLSSFREAQLREQMQTGSTGNMKKRLDPAEVKQNWFPTLSDARLNDHISKHVSRWARHIALVQEVRTAIAGIDDPLHELTIPVSGRHRGLVGPPWWTLAEDRSLLVGVCRHGLNQFAIDFIRNDPDLTFRAIYDQGTATIDEFPHARSVELRIRALLFEISKSRKQREALQLRSHNKSKPKSSKTTFSPNSQRSNGEWVRSERRQVCRLFMQYGRYDIPEFPEQLPAHSTESIADYCEKLLNQCEQVTKLSDRVERGPQSASNAHSYCECQQPAGVGVDSMILCSNCFEWYHISCAGGETISLEEEPVWICSLCSASTSQRRRRRDFKRSQRLRRPHRPANRPASSVPMPDRLMQRCSEVLEEVSAAEFAVPFLMPVDPIAMGVPLYHRVIKRPMDLHSLMLNLRAGAYSTAHMFAEDFRLIGRNCCEFNQRTSEIAQCAICLSASFEKAIAPVLRDDLSEPTTTEIASSVVGQVDDADVVDRDLSKTTAKRILYRVNQMRGIGECLQLDDLPDRLSSRVDDSGPGPEWWRPHHDIFLLRSVYRHGVGANEKIFSDSELTADLAVDTRAGAKQMSYLQTFMADKSPLHDRLDGLVAFLLD